MRQGSLVQVHDGVNTKGKPYNMTRTMSLVHHSKENHGTEKSITVDENVVTVHPNLHPEVVGKRVHVI